MTWRRDGESRIVRHGYRIERTCTGSVNVYRAFAPNGAFLVVGGGDTAEEFQRSCEEHERKMNAA